MIRGGPLRGGLASAAPLLENPRFEVFPARGVEDAVAEWIPAGMTVTVTASPAKGLDATLDMTERLAELKAEEAGAWMAAYDQGRADAAEVFEGQIDDMANELAELKAEEAGPWEAGA